MPRYGLFINIHHFIISSFHENPTMIGTLAVCACLNQDLLPSERFTSDDIWDWPWVHSYDSKRRTTTLILVYYPWERTFSFVFIHGPCKWVLLFCLLLNGCGCSKLPAQNPNLSSFFSSPSRESLCSRTAKGAYDAFVPWALSNWPRDVQIWRII